MATPSEADVRKGVREFWAAWARSPTEEQEATWVNLLTPYWGRQSLRLALRDFAEKAEWVPTVPQLLAAMRKIDHEGERAPPQERRPLNERERRSLERTAIMSVLWLHYELGWQLEDFDGHPMVEHFGGNLQSAFEAAKAQYTPATIRRWMSDHAKMLPAPCDGSLSRHLDV